VFGGIFVEDGIGVVDVDEDLAGGGVGGLSLIPEYAGIPA